MTLNRPSHVTQVMVNKVRDYTVVVICIELDFGDEGDAELSSVLCFL